MKNLFVFFLCLPFLSFSQDIPTFNFDFETVKEAETLPKDWFKWGTPNFEITSDETEKQHGKTAIKVASNSEDGKGFGCPAYKIPAKYEGKKIKLTGYIKMEKVREGNVGLLLRIDGESGSLAFDNMQSKNITGTNDWKQYTIELDYPDGAQTIFIGGILSGKGTAWFDNFDVMIDGRSITKLKTVAPKLFPAQLDKEFDEGSKIEKIVLTPEKTQSLATLGKMWGYLKYYHPKIATGDINWDYELFRVMPEYLAAPDHKTRAEVAIKWIEKLGEFEKGDYDASGLELKLKADYQWFGENRHDELIYLLIRLRTADRTGKHFQMGFAPNVGNPVIKNEVAYEDFQYPDVGFRLLALYRYWNIINYFFPYKHLTDDKWDQVMLDFVPKFVNAKNELEYKLALLELIGKVQDTHANIWMQDDALSEFFGNNVSAVKIKMVEEKAMVVGYHDDEKGKASGLKIGDIITTIDGSSVESIIEKMLPHLPASNYPTQLRDVAKKLLRTNKKILDVTYLRNEKEHNIALSTFPKTEIKTWKRSDKKSWKVMDGDIGYIYPGTIKDGDIEDMKKNLLSKKGIVIDLRCYPSKFMVFDFGNFLTPEAKPFVKFTLGTLMKPGNFNFGSNLSVGGNDNGTYQGKIAILINEQTQSQAEYTTMAFQTSPNNKVFGSTTAGADGNVSTIILPGKIRTMISGIGVYYPDGTETQRVGIVPDVEVKPTIKGLTEGKDEVLEKALKWIKK